MIWASLPVVALEQTVVGVGSSLYDPNSIEPTLKLIAEIMKKSDIRRLGSAALDLSYVASGRQGAYFEFNIKPWDIAAGMLIAREAGAIVTTTEGKEPPLDRHLSILAAGPETYAEFRKMLNF